MAVEPSKSTAVAKRSTDTELMPPPPKRIKRPKNVIDEESYTDAISEIIARDFFPGLLEAEVQQEYLDAQESRDPGWISSASRRLSQIMTPGRRKGRRGTSIQSPLRASDTPRTFAGDTPMSVVSDATTSAQATRSMEVDTNMSLDKFQSMYTSEDNESFYKLLDKQNQKRAEKYAWMWTGNKLPSKMMLKQNEVETKLLQSRESLEDDGGRRDRLAIRDVAEKSAKPDSWKSKPQNGLMFKPESVEDSIETVAQKAQNESRAAPKGVAYGNTRMPATSVIQNDLSAPPSPSLSAVRDAIVGRRRSSDLESGLNGSETPRVNGYAFVDDEPEEETYVPTPTIDLGKGDLIKNPFVIKEQSRREDLHHRMVDTNARTKRASSKYGMTGKIDMTPIPKFPSSPRVGPGGLTPAAQRLWSRVGNSSSRGPSDSFGTRTPAFGDLTILHFNPIKLSQHGSLVIRGYSALFIMAGKRLLDIAAIFNASRGVAQKHIALRARQVDVFNQTSTLAKALRNQTERVTETAKAASILASRLNESAPAWTKDIPDDLAGNQSDNGHPIPSRKSTERKDSAPAPKNGLQQDHFYERSEHNNATDPRPGDDLSIQQETADRYPLPDGSITPEESDINTPELDHETISARNYDKPTNERLDESMLQPISSGTSSISFPKSIPITSHTARTLQQQSELQIPSKTADAEDKFLDPLEEGRDEDSFYRKSEHTSPTLSSLPRVRIPKHPSNIQESDPHLPGSLNPDIFYNPGYSHKSIQIPSIEAVPEQDQVPEGINTDIFHSPRVTRALGGKTEGVKKDDLELKGVQDTPVDHSDIAEGKDQDTFNVRLSSQKEPINLGPSSQNFQSTDKNGSPAREEAQQPADDISIDRTDNKVEMGTASIPYELRESTVPSSRLGRLWNYGGLAAGMFGGAVSESLRRVGGSGGEGSYMFSAGNMDRLVAKLSRMRGAALKLGQMISFQDSKMLPAPIQEVLQRVQDRADYMPSSQRNKVLITNLGPDWRDLFSTFDEKPLAAASIGQVHSAILKSTGARVAVKIQYPGVADSIDSDLNNLAILLTASRLLPKGLFLDKTIDNARIELAWECDYIREAECGRRFEGLLADETDVFVVPKVYPEASGKQVLTTAFMDGIGVTRVKSFTQEQKDWIGTQILRLCLREITEFRFMQTDPNWTNFLFNAKTNKLELLDFGASREYPKEFIMNYTKLLAAASRTDKDSIRTLSIELGYLTGHESKAMLKAHISSILTLAEPFLASSPEVYNFRDQTITDRVKALIPVMIKERLSPPPEETYSLHRKLSGAFLLCARLGSRVKCRELFENSMKKAGLV
ncbi:hypothetical protein B7494_g1264 [Chlorociboria aeruginascens]|nr:hypothetical protein B7494_g1264 [Chlorociboria aeruginascens]